LKYDDFVKRRLGALRHPIGNEVSPLWEWLPAVAAGAAMAEMGTDFRFVTCKKEHFFGTVDHWATKQEKVAVSDMEKTIIDGLRQPEHCGGITETAKAIWTRRQNLNGERLIEYALRLDMGAVVRRLGYLMKLYGIGLPKNLGSLRDHLTDTYAKLDSLLPPEGKFVSKWRLQLNVSPDELLSAGRT
jgi:predicted transcriptional regulator of viral defense system